MIYWIVWVACRCCSYFFFPIKVIGKENIPSQGNFVIASNHVSNLDPVIIPLCLNQPINFMAKESLFNVFFIGPLIKRLRAYPIKRESSDIRAVKETLKRLKEGHPVLIFPQGTRFSKNSPQTAQPGIGFIVAKSGLPVLPVFIDGSSGVMPPGFKGLKRHPVKVIFGRIQSFSPATPYQDIANQIMDTIHSLS